VNQRALIGGLTLGVMVGILIGWLAGPDAVALSWAGDLLLNHLKMLVLPLVFCSMVSAVTGIMGTGSLRSVALYTFGYYLMTTFIAVSIGLVVVNTIGPGVGLTIVEDAATPDVAPAGITAIIDSMVAPNLFEAATNFRVLPILVFALLFGAALAGVGEEGRAAIRFFHAANAALLKLVDWVMILAPFGVAALIAARIGKAGGLVHFGEEARAVGSYCVAVLVGLAIHATIVLPMILAFIARRNPLRYASALGGALLTAFATASSSATLAVTMRLTEEEGKVSEEATSFVLPLGATVNMDGTALYEAVAALFIAQAAGIDLSLTQQVTVALTATLASIGAAGIPQAGLVTMVIVLEAVGLPFEGISLILAVDWFLDRCRTTVNVWGDAVGAAVVDSRKML
jgi:Na+/H+-dicarboxylate symporter